MSLDDPGAPSRPLRRIVLVTGLSGAGKASVLRMLEDIGYEAVDNTPLPLIEELVARGERAMALGVDARSRGFAAPTLLDTLARLKLNPALQPELVFVWATEATLLRRFTETRRRHPMAPSGRVRDGIEAEASLTGPLREAADWLVDTSRLPLPALRLLVDQRFRPDADMAGGMTLTLLSFAFPEGLPADADMVLDARFLRNPHYDPILRERSGLDPKVAAYVAADPDFLPFLDKVTGLLTLLLPRFVQEGKKYVAVAIGCTGGRHRSVHVVESLAARLQNAGQGADWRVNVSHRELLRERAGKPDVEISGAETSRENGTDRAERDIDGFGSSLPVQAQEA